MRIFGGRGPCRTLRSVGRVAAVNEENTGLSVPGMNGERRGESPAHSLFPLVYDQLREIARVYISRERAGHTLQPTALVNEAYLKLANQNRVNWQNRSH